MSSCSDCSLLPGVSGANVFLNLDCNLDCPYCYVDKSQVRMSQENMQATIDMLSEWARRHGGFFHIGFLGGEPFLRFPALRYVTDELEARSGRRISFTVTTNGTVLTDEIVEWVRSREIRLIVSCDGGEAAMQGRPYKRSGLGSYEKVAASIRKLSEESVPFLVQMTITPMNCGALSHNLLHVVGLGARQVIFGLASSDSWTPDQRADLAREMARVFEWYKQIYRDGKDVFLKFVQDEVTGYLIRRQQAGSEVACGMLNNVVAVSCAGGIYPCQSMVNFEDQRVGHVAEGLDAARIRSAVLPVVDEMPRCNDCALRHYCRKCVALNRAWSPDILINPDVACTAGMTSAVLCEEFATTLLAEKNERFLHDFAPALAISSGAIGGPRTEIGSADDLTASLLAVGPLTSEEQLPAYLPGAYGVPEPLDSLPEWRPRKTVLSTGDGRGSFAFELGAYRHVHAEGGA